MNNHLQFNCFFVNETKKVAVLLLIILSNENIFFDSQFLIKLREVDLIVRRI